MDVFPYLHTPAEMFERLEAGCDVAGAEPFVSFITLDDDRVRYAPIPNNGERMKMHYMQIVKGAYREEKNELRHVDWSLVSTRMMSESELNATNRANVCIGFRYRNKFLTKAFFTFGLRRTRPDEVHLIQTFRTSVLYYEASSTIDEEYYAATERERTFRCEHEKLFRAYVLKPNSVYVVEPDKSYVLLTVQKTLFAVDRMDLHHYETFVDLHPEYNVEVPVIRYYSSSKRRRPSADDYYYYHYYYYYYSSMLRPAAATAAFSAPTYDGSTSVVPEKLSSTPTLYPPTTVRLSDTEETVSDRIAEEIAMIIGEQQQQQQQQRQPPAETVWNHHLISMDDSAEPITTVKEPPPPPPPPPEVPTFDTEKAEKDISQDFVCKICMVNEKTIVFLPCNHLMACETCAPKLNGTCPICRKPIDSIIRSHPC